METHEPEISQQEAAALIAWYRAIGVDEAVCDAPRSWFGSEDAVPVIAETPRAVPLKRHPENATLRQAQDEGVMRSSGVTVNPQTGSGVTGSAETRDLVRSASNLTELRALLESFDGCALKKTAKRTCMARGSDKARVMLIGEAPGKDEDAQGVPFVGRAGQLLDRMLGSMGLGEQDFYITNIVFWRPPGNRTPSPEEAQVCLPFVERQIELIAPEILVFLGGTAAKQLTGASDGILKLRGKWLSYNPHAASSSIRAIATLHPAYLLRAPIAKRLAWRDLLMVREALDEKT